MNDDPSIHRPPGGDRSPPHRGFAGRRVLVVEARDGSLFSPAVESGLADHGAIVIGPVSSVHDALERSAEIEAALLDIALPAEAVVAIAESLQARRIPFVVATPPRSRATARHPGYVLSSATLDLVAEALFGTNPPNAH